MVSDEVKTNLDDYKRKYEEAREKYGYIRDKFDLDFRIKRELKVTDEELHYIIRNYIYDGYCESLEKYGRN